MGTKSKEVDAYIAKAPDYARPILTKVRALFHKADATIVEARKWGAPAFERDGIVAIMAAFKSYVGINFWQRRHLTHPAATVFEGRFASVKDLPSDRDFIACVKEAIALNQPGNKPKAPARKAKPPLPMPPYFAAALKTHAKARAAFDKMPPSHRREYIEWIVDAKREETRARRIEQAIAWIADGKQRNWKYQ
jgi:uncharacterized protein YdeI (YjbR/CyaY-like superfamily)